MKATGYKFDIYRSTSEGGAYTKIAELQGNIFEYLDGDLSVDQAYWYKLKTVDPQTGLESDFTTPVSCLARAETPPSVPTGLSVTSNDKKVSLQWVASTKGTHYIEQYLIYRSDDGSDYYLVGCSTVTTFTDYGVEYGSSYHYVVSARDIMGIESDKSAPVQTTVAGAYIDPPTNLEAVAGADAVKLSWTASLNAARYKVYKNNSYVGETTETSFIEIDANHVSRTYRVKAVTNTEKESAPSSPAVATPVPPSAAITSPASPHTTYSGSVELKGTSQEDFSIKYVEIKIDYGGGKIEYTRAGGAKDWHCLVQLDGNCTVYARAESKAGNISAWSNSISITVSAPGRVYKRTGDTWTLLDNTYNVTVEKKLNAANTASFSTTSKQLESKNYICIRASDNIYFSGRVLDSSHSNEFDWSYALVDDSGELINVYVDELDDDWRRENNINSVLLELFKSANRKGFIKIGIEAISDFAHPCAGLPLDEKSLREVLEYIVQFTGDEFYYDCKLGKIVFFTPPTNPSSSGLVLEYGQNISTWNVQERTEQIINSAKLTYSIENFPVKADALTEFAVKKQILGFPDKGRFQPFLGVICADYSRVYYTVEAPPVEAWFPIIVNHPMRDWTFSFKIGRAAFTEDKGRPAALPTDLPPDFHVVFQLREIKVSSRQGIGPTILDDPNPLVLQKEFIYAGLGIPHYKEGGTIKQFNVSFAAEGTETEEKFYYCRVAFFQEAGGGVDLRNCYIVSWVNDKFGANVWGTTPPWGTDYFWTASGEVSQSIHMPPKAGKNCIGMMSGPYINPSQGGGKITSPRGLGLRFGDYTSLSLYLCGSILVTLYPLYHPPVCRTARTTPHLVSSMLDPNWEEIKLPLALNSDQEDYVLDYFDITPDLYGVAHIDDLAFVGALDKKISKSITDFIPGSTSIEDYGRCLWRESRRFPSTGLAQKYIENLLTKHHQPLTSITFAYPYLSNLNLGNTIEFHLPDYADTKRIVGLQWDLDAQTTQITLEASIAQSVIAALKNLMTTR